MPAKLACDSKCGSIASEAAVSSCTVNVHDSIKELNLEQYWLKVAESPPLNWLNLLTHSRWCALCLLYATSTGQRTVTQVITWSNATAKTSASTRLLGCGGWGVGEADMHSVNDRRVQQLAKNKQISSQSLRLIYITTALHLPGLPSASWNRTSNVTIPSSNSNI